MDMNKHELTRSEIPKSLFQDVRSILADARQRAYAAVNFIMVEAYWKIGRRIVKEEQGGKGRAEYGAYLIKELSRNLGEEFGRGFSVANLKNFRQFYTAFPDFEKGYALRSELTWTHYRLIMRLENEKPLELSELLKENFLLYDGKGEVLSQIHSYLSSNFKELRNLAKDDPALRAKGKDRWYVPDPNRAGDLEKLRERALMREFEEYRESKQKRLKVFRLEAVRSGFKKAWQERDYATIIAVARKIPEKILQEDPKLLMWYDQALTRMGGE